MNNAAKPSDSYMAEILKEARRREYYLARDVARIAVEKLQGMDEASASGFRRFRHDGESPADFCARLLAEIFAEGHRGAGHFDNALRLRLEGKSSAIDPKRWADLRAEAVEMRALAAEVREVPLSQEVLESLERRAKDALARIPEGF